MKVKVINKNTNQQFDCEEVEISGYKYYLYYNTEPKKIGQYYITKDNQVDIVKTGKELGKPILCTNNPNIDIPKVVDDVEVLYPTNRKGDMWMPNRDEINNQYRQEGYSKSQETHPNSDEDMKSFGKFCIENNFCKEENRYYQYWEMLKLWKEQQPKKVYYNG